jgi:hypothetical protein
MFAATWLYSLNVRDGSNCDILNTNPNLKERIAVLAV